jgi:hypothetical protein
MQKRAVFVQDAACALTDIRFNCCASFRGPDCLRLRVDGEVD